MVRAYAKLAGDGLCAACAGEPAEPAGPRAHGSPGRTRCAHCGDDLVARGTSRRPAPSEHGAPPPGGVMLWWRNGILRLVEALFWTVTLAGTLLCFACGGFVRVIRGWLRNEINSWADVVASFGGVWFAVETKDPDSDLGPVLARVDAPQLFATIESVGRRLGVRPPGQVRLTYLPCCGVVAWGRSRALIIGLPLFRVLTQGELRAVVAHELAHLARGDATRAARSARFVETLERAVELNGLKIRGPLGAWARFCLNEASWLIEPVARGQELRADRSAAMIAGGSAASSALVKVAVVQPLFREVLRSYEEASDHSVNLYAFFRSFWYRLSPEFHSAMRMSVLTNESGAHDLAHPPLPDRIAALQAYPDPAILNGEALAATTFLGDLEVFEQMLHNRLFGLPPVEPSVFHPAGS